MLKRVILLMTTNNKKVPEYQKHFSKYGIQIEQVDPEANLFELFRQRDGIKVLAAMKDESNLYVPGTLEKSNLAHLSLVDQVTTLVVYWPDKYGKLEGKKYEHRTEGYIDLRQKSGCKDVFGWDDIFVLSSVHETYYSLQKKGFKVSSRDMVISRYISDFLHYKSHKDLKFSPQKPEETIDFSHDVIGFVEKNEYLSNPLAREWGLTDMYRYVSENGVFFRAPKTRREKNYWWPGLNAGIPYTEKKDAIHEVTYMAHDLGHFLLPDLIFKGYSGSNEKVKREVYIIYRMMSEAVTLVMADMLFVDSLARSGYEYDWSKRQIYPLFKDTGIIFEKGNILPGLEKLLRANVAYCLRGDDSLYRKLLIDNGKGAENLELFKDKYAPFFVEDFRWTEHNYENMSERSEEFSRWWWIVRGISEKYCPELETAEKVADKMYRPDLGSDDLINMVFERVMGNIIRPIFNGWHRKSDPKRVNKAFVRYMIGQLGLFARYGFVPESETVLRKIKECLIDGDLSKDMISRIRAFYASFVDSLVKKNLLALDDATMYKSMFPLFEAFYVHYDEDKSSYESLADVSERILGK
jgi:inosine/xanthosine triphosphate pyrophosphatase family protein